MAEEKVLKDEELEEVSGGLGVSSTGNEATYVCFEVDYSYRDGRYKIRDFIKNELRNRGVPEDVIAKVPTMNPEKSYMSYGSGGIRVTWQSGWPEAKYERTND